MNTCEVEVTAAVAAVVLEAAPVQFGSSTPVHTSWPPCSRHEGRLADWRPQGVVAFQSKRV